MRYTPCWKQIGISQERYFELLHFCRQYPEWINILMNSDTQKYDEALRKISIVDNCAKAIGEGEWYSAIIEHICYNKTHNKLDPGMLPNSDRNAFYKQRRLFFELLNQNKD